MNLIFVSVIFWLLSLKLVANRGACSFSTSVRPCALIPRTFVKSASSAKSIEKALASWRFQASTKAVSTCLIPFSSCSRFGGVTVCESASDKTRISNSDRDRTARFIGLTSQLQFKFQHLTCDYTRPDRSGRIHGFFSSQSIWKRGSPRSGSHFGSSLRSAGVRQLLYGISKRRCTLEIARSLSPNIDSTTAKFSSTPAP